MNRLKVIVSTATLAVCLFTGALAAEGGAGGAGGAGGGAGGAGGGGGGNGGDGENLPAIPEATDEQIAAFEKTLTSQQRATLEEWNSLVYSAKQKELKELEAQGTKEQIEALRTELSDRAQFNREAMSWIVVMKPAELQTLLNDEVPPELERLRKNADAWYVNPADVKAAENLGAEAQKAADSLLADDLEAFIIAERKVLSYGPEMLALVAATGRKTANDPAKAKRIQAVLAEFSAMKKHEKTIRVVAAAEKRLSELEKSRPNDATGKLACMISRSFAFNSSDSFGEMVYFSMPKGVNGYKGAVSLQFCDGNFDVRMYGGQENAIRDLGAVDYAGVKSAPNADETERWDENAAPEIGHVYVEHCLEPSHKIDATFKFRVLELKPGEWVVIEYEKIPQKQ